MPLINGADNNSEEIIEHLGDLAWRATRRQFRRVHQVDEKDRRLPHVSGQRRALFDGAAGHIYPDVTTEQVP